MRSYWTASIQNVTSSNQATRDLAARGGGGGVGKLCGLQLEHRGVCYWSGLQGRTGQIARGAGQVLLGPPELMWELCVH